MDITKGQLETAVRGLLSQDKYKLLSQHLGGWFWTTEAIWAIVDTFKSMSLDSLETMSETALTVPSHLASLLADFVADLFAILAIIVDEAGDVPSDAEEFAQTSAGQVLLGLVAPEQYLLDRSGGENSLAQGIALILNPMPLVVKTGASVAKNTVDAGQRILSYSGGRRTRR